MEFKNNDDGNAEIDVRKVEIDVSEAEIDVSDAENAVK